MYGKASNMEKEPRLTATFIELSADDAPLIFKMPAKYASVLTANGSMHDKSIALGIPIGTVKSRSNRAKHMLLKLRKQAAKEKENGNDGLHQGS